MELRLGHVQNSPSHSAVLSRVISGSGRLAFLILLKRIELELSKGDQQLFDSFLLAIR